MRVLRASRTSEHWDVYSLGVWERQVASVTHRAEWMNAKKLPNRKQTNGRKRRRRKYGMKGVRVVEEATGLKETEKRRDGDGLAM